MRPNPAVRDVPTIGAVPDPSLLEPSLADLICQFGGDDAVSLPPLGVAGAREAYKLLASPNDDPESRPVFDRPIFDRTVAGVPCRLYGTPSEGPAADHTARRLADRSERSTPSWTCPR